MNKFLSHIASMPTFLAVVWIVVFIFLVALIIVMLIPPPVDVPEPPAIVQPDKTAELLQQSLSLNLQLVERLEKRVQQLEDELKFFEADWTIWKEYQEIGEGK